MTLDQEFVIWVSIIGSLLSAAGCIYAAIKVVSWKFGALLKLALVGSATFALTYCASYVWLLFHDDSPTSVALWSRTLRPVGMLAWILGPWTILPWALIRQVLRLSNRMVSETREVIAEVQLTGPCVKCYEDNGGCPILGRRQGDVIPSDCPVQIPSPSALGGQREDQP